MIDKREILAAAQQTSLLPHVVEKDYVLGWMLAGIPFVAHARAVRHSCCQWQI